MAKRSKPKLIPLRELRALCDEAGVEVSTGRLHNVWFIYRNGRSVGTIIKSFRDCRQNLKAFCLGLIAMRKAGEL